MSSISTHVLDTERGRPASGVPVLLQVRTAGRRWKALAKATTDSNGRILGLLPSGVPLSAGTYRLVFDTSAYFRSGKVESFYPEVSVVFTIRDARQHYHVPLLLGPYGYTTYRGS